MTLNSQRAIARGIAITFVYVLFRFVLIRWLDSLGEFAAYGFEALFVTAVMVIYRKRIKLMVPVTGAALAELLVAAVAGLAIFKTAAAMNMVIPFDFSSTVTLVFLLLVGPLLEELIFRQALWFAAEDILKNQIAVMIVTALFFSAGHFQAYMYVPEEIKSFVLYQTAYTLGLGIWWGYRFAKQRALMTPLMLHVTFNLGFWLGSML